MKRMIPGSVAILVLLIVSVGYAATGGTISGTVKGPDGKPFRAAFIRAENLKTKMRMTVLSDKDGKFYTDKLPPGTYRVRAMTLGYRGDPASSTDVTVEEGKDVSHNVTMQETRILWSQLNMYQAGTLIPEAPGKGVMLQECFNCHAFGKIGAYGRHDVDGWKDALEHMRQVNVFDAKPDVEKTVTEYLANVLGPDSTLSSSPAQLPEYQKVKQDRDYFSDDSLNIVYVDYEVTGMPTDRPGTGKPDKDGNIWLEIPGGTARLEPETGKVTTYYLPDSSRPGIHEVLPTADGSVWLTVTDQGALARLDVRTGKFDPIYVDSAAVANYNQSKPVQKDPNDPFPNLPKPEGNQGGAARNHTAVIDHQGNLWVSGRPLKKFDTETKKFIFFPDVPDTYGIDVDQRGNVWFAEFNSRDHQEIGMVDVKTNKVVKFHPEGGFTPRRLKIDSQGNIWVGDYFGGNLWRFDPKTNSFKAFKIPGPMPTPYGVGVDHNDNVWYASIYTDVIGRLDTKTGKFTEYPTPYGEKHTRDLFEDAQGRIWFGAQPYFKVGYVRLRTNPIGPVAQTR
jgi:virginiamycin B lyase